MATRFTIRPEISDRTLTSFGPLITAQASASARPTVGGGFTGFAGRTLQPIGQGIRTLGQAIRTISPTNQFASPFATPTPTAQATSQSFFGGGGAAPIAQGGRDLSIVPRIAPIGGPTIPPAPPVPPAPPAPESIGLEGLPEQLQQLYDLAKKFLDDLQRRGQIINPAVSITPERIAEFMDQASKEIDPFYAEQLKLAKESFLTDVGYSKEEIARLESETERMFGQATRRIGEELAERGFAQSGLRRREETELAEETQRAIELQRRQLTQKTGAALRQFYQKYGAPALPQEEIPKLPPTPRALPGEERFERTGREFPFYELPEGLYRDIVGSSEFERRGAVSKRGSELEEAERRKQELERIRSLTL